MMRKPNQRRYTVLLLRPDYVAANYGADTFLAHTRALNAEVAVEQAARAAAARDGQQDRSGDYHPLITLEGWHSDITPEAFR